jgi:hypothetical protein
VELLKLARTISSVSGGGLTSTVSVEIALGIVLQRQRRKLRHIVYAPVVVRTGVEAVVNHHKCTGGAFCETDDADRTWFIVIAVTQNRNNKARLRPCPVMSSSMKLGVYATGNVIPTRRY